MDTFKFSPFHPYSDYYPRGIRPAKRCDNLYR